ncbi:transposase [Nostoc sp.]|uniref:transposase n=1 Tax=Nostoc sp. TaxID=1180 RepID=UPI003FA5DF2E
MGVFYQLNNGCNWEDLPNDLPIYSTVYDYFRLLYLVTCIVHHALKVADFKCCIRNFETLLPILFLIL